MLAERLRDNGLVCLMADRDLTRVRGRRSTSSVSPPGCLPGRRSWRSRPAPRLLPAHCWYEGDGWVIDLTRRWTRRRGDVTAVTQALADRFARNIAAHPADWHMMQPQWLADLSDERRAKLEAT